MIDCGVGNQMTTCPHLLYPIAQMHRKKMFSGEAQR